MPTTVKDLIKKLQNCPQDAILKIETSDSIINLESVNIWVLQHRNPEVTLEINGYIWTPCEEPDES